MFINDIYIYIYIFEIYFDISAPVKKKSESGFINPGLAFNQGRTVWNLKPTRMVLNQQTWRLKIEGSNLKAHGYIIYNWRISPFPNHLQLCLLLYNPHENSSYKLVCLYHKSYWNSSYEPIN